MSDFKKKKLKQLHSGMPRQCPLHTCQVLKKIKIKIITQWRATSASGRGQGCFVENLHIIGLESKLFF